MFNKALRLIFPLLLCCSGLARAETVPLTEADGEVAVSYGITYGNTTRYTSFQLIGGYRFFPKLSPQLSFDLNVALLGATTNENLFAVAIGPKYYFSEENRGFSAGLGLGYATRTSTSGFTLVPTVGYDFRISNVFTVGPEVPTYLVFGSTFTSVFAGLVTLKYWF